MVKVLQRHVSREDLKIGVLKAEKMLNSEDSEHKEGSTAGAEDKPVHHAQTTAPEKTTEPVSAPKPEAAPTPVAAPAPKPAAAAAPAAKDALKTELEKTRADAATAMQKADDLTKKISDEEKAENTRKQQEAVDAAAVAEKAQKEATEKAKEALESDKK